jgi:uncharacterized protein
MAGEEELSRLLRTMSPTLIAGEFVFCSFEGARYGDHSYLTPMAAAQELEGLTLVVPRSKADEHALEYDSVFRCITLTVHSSLDAVGLTAAVSSKLAEHGISANVMAGFYHDHIFIPARIAEQALAAIRELSR